MTDLRGKIALVTGGSRGVGKGIALGLAEAGATVYVTGRTVDDAQPCGGCIPISDVDGKQPKPLSLEDI